jgi:hypothetical protein
LLSFPCPTRSYSLVAPLFFDSPQNCLYFVKQKQTIFTCLFCICTPQ